MERTYWVMQVLNDKRRRREADGGDGRRNLDDSTPVYLGGFVSYLATATTPLPNGQGVLFAESFFVHIDRIVKYQARSLHADSRIQQRTLAVLEVGTLIGTPEIVGKHVQVRGCTR